MNDDKKLIAAIINGMQEKKAKHIVTINLTKIDAPCRYFVICEGYSKIQIATIATSIKDRTKAEVNEKPFPWTDLRIANGLQWTTAPYWYMFS